MPDSTSALLQKLCSNDEEYLIAYQIAFDLVDKEQQTFTSSVLNQIVGRFAEFTDQARFEKLRSILSGEVKTRLHLQFLKKNNNCDMILIGNVKQAIGTKNSMLHMSTIWMNGIMNAYTTNDSFLRDNLQWTAASTNWNRFNATASLGMIHMGNAVKALEILNPYLVGAGGGQS